MAAVLVSAVGCGVVGSIFVVKRISFLAGSHCSYGARRNGVSLSLRWCADRRRGNRRRDRGTADRLDQPQDASARRHAGRRHLVRRYGYRNHLHRTYAGLQHRSDELPAWQPADGNPRAGHRDGLARCADARPALCLLPAADERCTARSSRVCAVCRRRRSTSD